MRVIHTTRIGTTIPSGSETASAVALEGYQLVGVWLPAGMLGSSLSYNVAQTPGDTLYPLASGGAIFKETVTASAQNWLNAAAHLSYNVVQFVTTGTAQTSARNISAIVRPMY